MSSAKITHPVCLDEDNIFLVGKVAKKGAVGGFGCLGNFVNGSLLVALLAKELNNCIKQGSSCQFLLLFT